MWKVTKSDAPHVPLEAVRLRDAIQHDGFLTDLRRWMRADQICDSRRERVIHAYGKGFRDLFRMRRGLADGAPDLVLYPENESDVLEDVAGGGAPRRRGHPLRRRLEYRRLPGAKREPAHGGVA